MRNPGVPVACYQYSAYPWTRVSHNRFLRKAAQVRPSRMNPTSAQPVRINWERWALWQAAWHGPKFVPLERLEAETVPRVFREAWE